MKSCLILSLSIFLFADRIAGQSYVLPVSSDCTKYQVCDYSGCFVFNCGIGTEFNPRIRVCDYPLRDRGACGSREVFDRYPTVSQGQPAANYPVNQQQAPAPIDYTRTYPVNHSPPVDGYQASQGPAASPYPANQAPAPSAYPTNQGSIPAGCPTNYVRR